MNLIEYKKVYDRFFNYIESFKEPDRSFCYLLEEKTQHIKRVTSNTVFIAKNEKWSDEYCLIAELCGLYHDVGRYSQYRDYKTFSDSKSVNHGEHGFEVIKENKMFDGLQTKDSEIILDAVHYHNALNIPDFLSDKSKTFTKLTRDADKIDIFYMLSEAIKTDSLDKHSDLLWNLPIGEANPVILDKLLNNSQALYSDIKSATDVCLLQFCWLYGINYKSSLLKIKQNQSIELISSILPKSKKIDSCIEHICIFIKDSLS